MVNERCGARQNYVALCVQVRHQGAVMLKLNTNDMWIPALCAGTLLHDAHVLANNSRTRLNSALRKPFCAGARHKASLELVVAS